MHNYTSACWVISRVPKVVYWWSTERKTIYYPNFCKRCGVVTKRIHSTINVYFMHARIVILT